MSVSKEVEYLLKNYPNCRNSDKALLVSYMQMKGMKLTKEQMLLFKELPSMETLRRIRQRMQMDGKYKADKEVEDQRFEKYVTQKHNQGLPPGYSFAD